MVSLNQNGINFTNISLGAATMIGGKITNSSENKIAAGKGNPIVDAVSIDWNGMEIDENTIINTTGQLISWIKNNIGNGTASLDEDQLETLETVKNLLGFIKDYALRTADADARYATKTALDTLAESISQFQTATDVQNAIQSVIGAAPAALDTLEEIASKLSENDNVLDGLLQTISEKVDISDFEEASRVTAVALADLDERISNIPEIIGPQGNQGADGANGAQGPQGADGANGAQGPQGADGANGAQGPQGADGANGAQGPQGADGANGAQGPQGNQGAQGPQGDTGAQGEKGDKGDTGAQGEKGDKGDTGTQGDQGPQGAQGPQGVQGPKGDTGTFDSSALENYATKEYVSTEFNKIVGEAPETFDTLKEIADWISEHGEVVGIQGPQGDKGDTGAQGADGANGVQGPQGDQGAQGADGANGVQGPQGDTGAQGADGANGIQGPQGDQGAQGADGANGAQGPQGDQGPQGNQGAQGPQGTFDSSALENYVTKTQIEDNERVVATALNDLNTNKANVSEVYTKTEIDTLLSGVQTTQGPQGDQGAQGANGANGVQGPQGDQGPQGNQGAQGPQGTFDSSALENYATKTEIATKLGNLGKITDSEAVYYTQEEINAAQKGEDAYGKTTEDIKTPKVEHDASVKELLDLLSLELDNDGEVTAAALTALNTNKANVSEVYTKTEIDTLLSGVQTTQGPQGDQGAQGADGTNGIQGPQGDQGAQGPQGTFDSSALENYATKEYVTQQLQGIQGGEGIVGPQGDQGANGAQGPQGDQGAQGANGAQGPQGDQGANGAQGPQGDQGAQGAQGAQGPQGTFDSSALENYVTKTQIEDNEEVVATALTDLNARIGELTNLTGNSSSTYESLVLYINYLEARIASLEGAQGPQGDQGAQGA